MKLNVSTSKKVKTLILFNSDFRNNSRLIPNFNSLEHLEPLKTTKNSMNNLMVLLLLLKLLYWEVKEKRRKRIIVLLKELNINTLLLNSILLVIMLLVKMDLFRELKNFANKKAAEKKESSWLLIGIDTIVVNVV